MSETETETNGLRQDGLLRKKYAERTGMSPWTAKDVRGLLELLREPLLVVGWGLGLTGSCLLNSGSSNDMDIIVFPLSTANQNRHDCVQVLKSNGLVRLLTHSQVVTKFERKAHLEHDSKHVEVWKDPDNRKLDVFFLS